MYKIGDKFKLTKSRSGAYDNHEYLLAHAAHNLVTLIDRNEGFRWSTPVTTDPYNICLHDLKTLMGELANRFVGIEGTIYPPKLALHIGDIELEIDKYGTISTRTIGGFLYDKEFILHDFIPAWEGRKKKRVIVKTKPACKMDMTKEALLAEERLNDGRVLWSGITLCGLLDWEESPEGRAYWSLADAVFDVETSTPVLANIIINTDSIKVGCKSFTKAEVNKFIRDYKSLIA